MVFDPKKYLIKVQGNRQYLPVSARLVWFRSEHPDWGIETEPLAIDNEKQYAIFRCRIFNSEGKLMAMGTKKEDVKGFGDFIEKAETGSVGRALAMCGYGTQFSPELDEVNAGRFADAPRQAPGGGNYSGGGAPRGAFNSPPRNFGNGGGGGGYEREQSAPPPAYNRNDAPPPPSYQSRSTPEPPVRSVSEPPARSTTESSNRPAPEPAVRISPEPQPRAIAETPPARPAPPAPEPARRPSPAPMVDEDEDDFESLIGGMEDDDDPFEAIGTPAPKPSPAAKASAPKLEMTEAPAATAKPAAAKTETSASEPLAKAASDGPPSCVNCGKALTKAQQELSIRNYGEALCPTCQKDKTRTPRPALAA